MGNFVDIIKSQQGKNDEVGIRELEMLEKLVENKLEAISANMKRNAMENKTLPILAVVDETQKCHVDVSLVPAGEVDKVIDQLLKGEFLKGVKSVLSTALNEFLGNVAIGETEEKYTNVVFANNGLLRIDYSFYKYQFNSKGLQDVAKNAFCYYLQVGVLDMEKTNIQITLYELTRAIDGKDVGAIIAKLQEIEKFATQVFGIIEKFSKRQETDRGISDRGPQKRAISLMEDENAGQPRGFQMKEDENAGQPRGFQMKEGENAGQPRGFQMKEGENGGQKRGFQMKEGENGGQKRGFQMKEGENGGQKRGFQMKEDENGGQKRGFQMKEGENAGQKRGFQMMEDENAEAKDTDVEEVDPSPSQKPRHTHYTRAKE